MRKLNFLKGIVDFVWITMLITIPFLLFFIVMVVIDSEPLDVPIKVNGTILEVVDLRTKVLFGFLCISASLIIYGLFLFRKLLRLFQLKIIFDLEIVILMKRLGFVIILSALLGGIPNFILEIVKNNISLSLGLNPFVLLFSLGLFFLVLSEVFVIAKHLKEENDLTF
ncbi:MAG: DUF2975 domain-containing protein [Flavobacterium sp.]|jgi:hypothetical protein|uniref:DUF2975 domain-containing protein n=1 Tax=Flavobacterium sp. TaxID=239 RepID=UPI0029728896|nr:DUF2975 domain-containing protein [Flavobacterium sp.]TAF11891.1 MAG: DUF2975 domain-containing protein [Flavobacteriia bacterium]WRH72233.1 MAG: DUF2975 domain-containing protein [Flavobacterium sp.]